MHGTSMRTGGAHMPPWDVYRHVHDDGLVHHVADLQLTHERLACGSIGGTVSGVRRGGCGGSVCCSGGIFATMGGASRDGGAPGSGDARAYL